jgi:hypothetical protein
MIRERERLSGRSDLVPLLHKSLAVVLTSFRVLFLYSVRAHCPPYKMILDYREPVMIIVPAFRVFHMGGW